MEKWIVYNKKADFKGIGARYGIDQVTARIIRNRDITEEDEIRLFLQGGLSDLHDPHLLKDVELLTDILADKIKGGAPIRIIGDYDIDGVMASYILKKALIRCGAEPSVVIPDRIADGYGLNRNLVTTAHSEGVDTILTCDNGIAALEEISLAKDLGMTVLVTDHHEIPYEDTEDGRVEKVSRADAVVNAHQSKCPYPNKDLCGAAVAWKMVCVLYEKMGIPREEALEFLENVAFATVGDIMSLRGENRILVKEGLRRIYRTKNVGMRALIAQCGLQPTQIRAHHFGFVLGPCINASGRLETAEKALQLLLTESESEAVLLASELVALNNERKAMTQVGVELARKCYEENGYEKDSVIVIYLPGLHESIAGIVAGRIREAYNKPTFILTDGAECVKGSGRSIEGYSMYERMCECRELFVKFGGHPMAAGLSMERGNIDEFRRKMNEHSNLTPEQLIPKIYIDVPMPLDYVNVNLVKELSVLEPFGKDNERPVFADKNVHIVRMSTMGKEQNFLRFRLVSSGGNIFQAVYFGDKEKFLDFLAEKYTRPIVEAALAGEKCDMEISMVYKPEIDDFRGVEELKFEVRNYC